MLEGHRFEIRRALAALATATVAAWCPSAATAATARTSALDPIAITVSASRTATVADLATSQVFPQLAAAPLVSAVDGMTVAIGISATGGLLLAPSLTQPAVPPTLTPGSPPVPALVDCSAVTSLGPGVLGIAVRTTGGDVLVLTSTTGLVGPWQVVDLAAQLGSWSAGAAPTLRSTSAGATEVVVTTTTGAVVDLVADGFGGHRWNAYNLTAITAIPAAVGPVAAASSSVDEGVETLCVRTTTGRLVVLVDDDAGFTVWRAVSVTLPSGVLAAAPPALIATSSGLVGAVTTSTGGLVVFGAPSSAGPWQVSDWSGVLTTHEMVAAQLTPAIATTATGVVVALRAGSGHLVEATAPTLNPPATSLDVSDLAGVGELVAQSPSIVATGTTVTVVDLDGGLTPLLQRVVALAKSKDQFGSAVVETPLNSNCNPYTAAFGRGWTSGCAKGTAAEEWCSDFADWVWMKSGADVSGVTGYSYSFVDHGTRLGTFKPGATNNPRPGDAVVWGYAASHVGDHVGLVVAVKGNLIDVVSGNSGPATPQGYNVAVWDSGFFNPATSHDAGTDTIVGYVTPTLAATGIAHLVHPAHPGTKAQIAAQDGGR